MSLHTQSLKRRLIAMLVGLTLAAWLLSVVVTALYASQTVLGQIDRLLGHYSNLVHHRFHAIKPGLGDDSALIPGASLETIRLEEFDIAGGDLAINYWQGNRQYLVGTKAPRFPSPQVEGIDGTEIDGASWRILYHRDQSNGTWLATGVNLDTIGDFRLAVWRIVAPLTVLLAVTLAILLWGVNRALRPMRTLAENIAARTPHSLEAIATDGVPAEMLPIIHALNDLLDRLHRALASEKRFTANAAHELQTPLAAIQTEVQRLQRVGGETVGRDMLDRIGVRVNRAAETVRQLLTLARLDPEQDFPRDRVDLAPLVMDEIADLGDLALARGIDFSFSGFSEAAPVRGNREWLRILVRNLLLNALRYSPKASEVTVELATGEQDTALAIVNHCDAIPAEEFSRLTDRFYRRADSGEQGVGLGLSIVQRIAELHGAALHLEPWRHGCGFVARVSFPRGNQP